MARPTPLVDAQWSAARHRLGISCWLVQPLYLVLELLVAAGATGAYSLRDDTISTLGQLGYAPGGGGVCSGGHAVLNAGFVVFGLLRVVGAVVLRDRFRPSRWRTAATTLWVLSGICAAAVGLAPVDQYPALHAAVAAPVFVLQPLAVLATVMAWGHADTPRGPRSTGLVAGALSLVGAICFGARLGQPTGVGALERLALWPAYLWLGLLAVVLLADARRCRRVRRPDARSWHQWLIR